MMARPSCTTRIHSPYCGVATGSEPRTEHANSTFPFLGFFWRATGASPFSLRTCARPEIHPGLGPDARIPRPLEPFPASPSIPLSLSEVNGAEYLFRSKAPEQGNLASLCLYMPTARGTLPHRRQYSRPLPLAGSFPRTRKRGDPQGAEEIPAPPARCPHQDSHPVASKARTAAHAIRAPPLAWSGARRRSKAFHLTLSDHGKAIQLFPSKWLDLRIPSAFRLLLTDGGSRSGRYGAVHQTALRSRTGRY